MEKIIFDFIDEILKNNSTRLMVPFQQRAKFEGWLKIELAAKLYGKFSDTTLEYSYPHNKLSHADIFSNDYYIELKTSDTDCAYNNCVPGRKRFSNNVSAILDDINKLCTHRYKGIVAFVLFPWNKNCQPNIRRIRIRVSKIPKIAIKEGDSSTPGYYIFVAKV